MQQATHTAISKIVIVGGGTAGWMTAAVLAAEHNLDQGRLSPAPRLEITLIESPDVATIGVGEGTWPSMRNTLAKIGLSETEFIRQCDASFKQGSRFIGWQQDVLQRAPAEADQYLHPFSLPHGHQELDLCPFWLPHRERIGFAEAVTSQERLSLLGLAPKTIATPEYHFQNNYGYHLDAGKFSQLLMQHSTRKLGVKHIRDHVTDIHSLANGDIGGLATRQHGTIHGDLFIDCSGVKSLLLGEHLRVPFLCQKSVLFNDSALALQVPYGQDHAQHGGESPAPIASCTLSTAQACGWIWDIGLPTRRGVGYVYSSAHSSENRAEQTLLGYLDQDLYPGPADARPEIRKLSINPGYHASCWQNNCIAIGMAAGFIEPLEASALALVEWSANTLAAQLPANRAVMDTVAARVNEHYRRHWQQIIDFLKLHYVLSRRELDHYWRDHRATDSIPARLQEQLELWRHHAPSRHDISHREALFPAASFQYVLYGMGFHTALPTHVKPSQQQLAQRLFNENRQRTQALSQSLPGNRELLAKVAQFGFPAI